MNPVRRTSSRWPSQGGAHLEHAVIAQGGDALNEERARHGSHVVAVDRRVARHAVGQPDLDLGGAVADGGRQRDHHDLAGGGGEQIRAEDQDGPALVVLHLQPVHLASGYHGSSSTSARASSRAARSSSSVSGIRAYPSTTSCSAAISASRSK